MNDTPRTDAIAHRGYNESAYIAEMTGLARELERELAESTESLAFQTQLNREVIELEKKTLGERNDARAELARLKATLADPAEVELAMIRGEIAIPHRVGFDYIIGNP
jgi:hypothetical protein